eukprot:9986042-Karenia_brevis.AAC.1
MNVKASRSVLSKDSDTCNNIPGSSGCSPNRRGKKSLKTLKESVGQARKRRSAARKAQLKRSHVRPDLLLRHATVTPATLKNYRSA